MGNVRYVKGNGKKIEGKYGEFIKISINKEDFNKLPDNKGYVRLVINDRKEPDQYGNNLTIALDTYVGEKKTELKPVDMKAQFIDNDGDELLPF